MKELAGLLSHNMVSLNKNIDNVYMTKKQISKRKDYDFFMDAFSTAPKGEVKLNQIEER